MNRNSLTSLLTFCLTWLVIDAKEDICKLLKDPGRCRASKQMFFFNMDTKRCEGFLYKGCGGNANKFENLEECHEACMHHLGDPEEVDVSIHLRGSHCLEPPLSDAVKTCYAYFPRFTFNPDTLQCEPYVYGGCFASSNLFLSEEECRTSCFFGEVTPAQSTQSQNRPTAAPPKGGKNKSKSKTTTTPSPVEDEETSSSDSEITLSPTLLKDESSIDICNLPPVHPHLISCLAFLEKWTYDSRQGSCVEYLYGGCYGTKNLFDSIEECQAKCASIAPSKTVDVCGLPIEKGPCRKFQLKFGFNKETNRCEKFAYGGCQGNENQFDSQEDCVNICGGHEPQEELMCSVASCDLQEAAFHRAKGCQPIVLKGECCPSTWDCGAWEERLRRWDECFWADEKDPRGRYYATGDSVPEASDEAACRATCTCAEGTDGEAQIQCTSADCHWPDQDKEGNTCHNLYQNPNACCPSQTKCDSELRSLATCKLDDVTYFAGQKMKPKSDPCKICLCKEGWNGQLNDKNFCISIECALGVSASSEMKRGCQPIYKEGVCCPIDWVCPLSDVPYNPVPLDNETDSDGTSSDKIITCPPGVAIRPGAVKTSTYPHPEEPLGISEMTEDRPPPKRRASDVCLLPKNVGLCEGFKDSWYFDLEFRKCKTFRTGATEDGGNMFETEANCQEICQEYSLHASSSQCQFSVTDSDDDEEDSGSISSAYCPVEQKRYQFNRRSGKCEDFITSSCGSGVVGYASMDECEVHCLPQPQRRQESSIVQGKADKCNSEPDIGPCRSRIARFYYDIHTGKCKKFWYGGCQGNHNNFVDERDCLDTCVADSYLARAVHPQDLDILSSCEQPGGVVGPCRAQKPRFFFDNITRTCKIFFYGGCGGNDNNFGKVSECQDTCPVDLVAQQNLLSNCDLPKEVGNCLQFRKAYFFNRDTAKCEVFSYSGCGGNQNNFESLENCQLGCVLPRALKAEVDQQAASGRSNSNRNVGPESGSESEDPCLLDRMVGLCKATIKRFYFDKTTRECKRFTYGGCGGNLNNFATQKQCLKRCARHMGPENANKRGKQNQESKGSGGLPTNPDCSLPVEVGPCRALRPSFFFNSQTKRCERFVYGGCRGNENRFSSLEDCESACSVPKKSGRGSSSAPVIVPLPPPSQKCIFGGQRFNLGDFLRFGNNRCRVCQCLTPPSLACFETRCPEVKFFPTGNSNCSPSHDDNGCCVTGYTCKPKAGQPDDCSKRMCAATSFAAPPAFICKSLEDGCCQGGMECTQN